MIIIPLFTFVFKSILIVIETSVKKRFEVKKVGVWLYSHNWSSQWNAVALWAWDIVVDNCAICRNHIMDLCKFIMYFFSKEVVILKRLIETWFHTICWISIWFSKICAMNAFDVILFSMMFLVSLFDFRHHYVQRFVQWTLSM